VAGRSVSARAAVGHARGLARRCGPVRTPGLALPDEPDLTPRERQVAERAARGLASRAIAEELSLSVRTVDNHLRNAYAKLGVAGRDELAGVL
jgi:DNA-binding CsgD family transcriptional regulator